MKFELNFNYLVSREIEQEFQKAVLEQIYYLSPTITACYFNQGRMSIKLSDDPHDTDLYSQISEVLENVSNSLRKFKSKIVFSHEPKELNFAVDPHPTLFDSKDICPHSDGNYILQNKVLRIVRKLDEVFFDFARSLNAVEQEYPTTIPIDSAIACGYIGNFPQHTGFISYVHKDLNSLKSLSETKNYSLDFDLQKNISRPSAILAPTVCYHCFQALKGKTMEREFMIFTANNKCHRNEDRLVVGLERLNTFHMREIIYFGSQEKTKETKKKIFLFFAELFEDWDIKSRIIGANDPFFATSATNKKTYQTAFDLKQELQIYLPYKNKWLAVGSINNHLETLTKSFSISGQHNQSLHSGCVGLGLERFTLGLFAQFGFEPKNWPQSLSKCHF